MPLLRLRSIEGQRRRGQELVFSGPRVRVGRGRDNDLILPERDQPTSSSHHAEALLDSSGSWWIVDVGSSNGTRVNDATVARHRLKAGDRVSFGDEQFIVAIGPAPTRWWIGAAVTALVVALLVTVVVVERRQSRAPFEDVAAAAARSVFMIALDSHGSRSVLGTGFAVGASGLIATNAHIASELEKRGAFSSRSNDLRALAVQGDTYDTRRIATAWIHRDWRPDSLQDDVALIQLDQGPALAPLRLASSAAIAAVTRGTPVAAFGFPAVSTDPDKPRGRLSVDVVGDVRGEYLEVGLGISPGTSGSPVFDQSGAVVAIVAGGDFVGGPEEPRRPSGSAANWALSAAVLEELLAAKR